MPFNTARFRLLFFLLPWLLSGCSSRSERVVIRSFYYWKSVFSLSDAEKNLLDTLRIEPLYVKYFDVDWDAAGQQPSPKASLQRVDSLPLTREIIPTVYIVNETLLKLPDSLVIALADQIYHKIGQTSRRLGNPRVPEVQLDCDWSEKSRAKYFSLLQHLRKKLKTDHQRLSATIRLHQVKYHRRTGVPPVDKGMLMFYNMGKLTDAGTNNSIFEAATAREYLYNFDTYPLPLDVVLPVFSWGVLIRKQRVIRLLSTLHALDLRQNPRMEWIVGNSFRVREKHMWQNQLFLPGDMIRMEEIDPKTALEAAALIEPHLRADTLRVALFHLDEKNLQPYTYDDLEKIYRIFN